MTREEANHCAPVLRRMVEMMGAEGSTTTFAEALNAAKEAERVHLTEEMETSVLIMAYRIVSSGKIPGLAEA